VIGAVAVVVPARDEHELLPDCLDRLVDAADAVGAGIEPSDTGDGIAVTIAVAADRSSRSTLAVAEGYARRDPRIAVVPGRWDHAGQARRAGTAAATARLGVRSTPARTWLASTDADTSVPPSWLATQVRLAEEGWEAVAGIVRIAAADPVLQARFEASYPLPTDRPHPYVHGANLGVRLDAYLAVGGWPTTIATGEDQRLWDRLRGAGHRTLASTALRVTTSDRTEGRAPDGFAARLRELSA
jgi:hypothetical protein